MKSSLTKHGLFWVLRHEDEVYHYATWHGAMKGLIRLSRVWAVKR